MSKLTSLKPRIGSLPPRLGYAPGDEKARDRHRAQTQHWRAWYTSTRWIKLRDSIRIRDLFTCRMCGRLCAGKGESAVDHIRPHRGDERLFYSPDNLQLLCKPCHDGAKQAEDKRTF